ncbi:hypothetical protein Efla_006686 [Eimeria flavescens]
MDSPPPQLREALPSAELFPAQPSGPETGPAAHSSLPSGNHSSSSHPSFGSHEVLEALEAAMHRLPLSSQVSQAPAMTPVGPSSAASASFCGASRKGLKYPTYDVRRSQEKAEEFLNVFAVVRSPNSLSNKNLVRFVVHHLRGDALLWWLELSESNRSQDLLDDWLLPSQLCAADFSSGTQLQHTPRRSFKGFGKSGVPGVALQAFPSGSAMESKPPAHRRNAFSATNKPTPSAKFPITSLHDGGADHSIMSRAFALTNGITMHPLDPPIARAFASNSSEVIPFATEPLQLQC